MPHDQYGNSSCSIHTDFIWRVHNYHRERQIQIASQLSAISSSSLNHNSNTVLVSTPELPTIHTNTQQMGGNEAAEERPPEDKYKNTAQ